LDLAALPRLKGIRTTGETLYRKHPLVADTYSAEEVGTIAIQCPDNSDAYHVMENVVVEIVDEEGRPASAGRVIVTDITSSYIHRYDIGDYAEFGECFCGRGLQTLRRILGRRRNMAVMPDGSKQWPRVGALEFRSVAPIRRYQAVQTSRTSVELRLVVDQPLSTDQERAVTGLVRKWMSHPFDVVLVYVEGFPAGKFEEFVCRV
jgi:phenylacetate-CoA ligase